MRHEYGSHMSKQDCRVTFDHLPGQIERNKTGLPKPVGHTPSYRSDRRRLSSRSVSPTKKFSGSATSTVDMGTSSWATRAMSRLTDSTSADEEELEPHREEIKPLNPQEEDLLNEQFHRAQDDIEKLLVWIPVSLVLGSKKELGLGISLGGTPALAPATPSMADSIPDIAEVTYADPETVFILSGSATVTPEGGEAVMLLPGDLASFPPGRTFIWKLQSEPLQLMRGIRTQGGQIVAEKLLKDVVPEGAPQEIISATSKKDEIGHRIDIIEYVYQWKFDDAMARQLRRKKFQLHCKAAVVVSRKKQFVLTIASEENRWPIRGDDYQIAIDTFKLTY
ncbi:unnamed protein product [Symbiodinium necroappetens]|uniref:(S)-ureidoglycine aminohydrolase cupin domain-containing protein n=1 Tax=Symbiodinium necroappetens TaxID=1628268 RepID=A0A812LMC9_9DINO|nr:unnamed protein product [Symbiodinium necroappetens]